MGLRNDPSFLLLFAVINKLEEVIPYYFPLWQTKFWSSLDQIYVISSHLDKTLYLLN